jgi:hypothetical protein
MTVSINFHHVSSMKADRSFTQAPREIAWLTISDARENSVTVFMDYDMACEIADLWEAMNREPEPMTFDEALGAKCDAERRLEEARALK